MESNKNGTKELIYGTGTNSDFKTKLVVPIGETIGVGGKPGSVGVHITV